jgi:signal transduction histidine kinase
MPRDLQVHVDRRQLLRVFTNLGRNAIEAGATCVTVTAQPHQGRVLVEVADDGPGLPERAKEKLFQPFAGSARNGGTGLGLVIVHDVIKAHGGEIELAASGPEGTVFRFTLPPAGWDGHD